MDHMSGGPPTARPGLVLMCGVFWLAVGGFMLAHFASDDDHWPRLVLALVWLLAAGGYLATYQRLWRHPASAARLHVRADYTNESVRRGQSRRNRADDRG